MSTVAASPVHEAAAARRRSILLVFCCTVLGAAAQILMKTGTNPCAHPTLWAMVTNVTLLSGYALYGLSTVLLVMALREGELSLLYPVIALTYVWVTGLSYVVLHESIGALRVTGIAVIVAGVTVLGRGDGK